MLVRKSNSCQAFNLVECREFRDMLLFLCEHIDDRDIPRRTRLVELITQRFTTDFAALMKELQVRHLVFCFQCILSTAFSLRRAVCRLPLISGATSSSLHIWQLLRIMP